MQQEDFVADAAANLEALIKAAQAALEARVGQPLKQTPKRACEACRRYALRLYWTGGKYFVACSNAPCDDFATEKGAAEYEKRVKAK